MYEEFVKFLRTFKPNSFVVKEGEEDTDFFCLLQGKVGIWKGDPEDKNSLVRVGEFTEPGTYFGEMSGLLEEPRTASIIAMDEPVRVLQFPGEMLFSMMLKQPKLGIKICSTLAARLRGVTDRQSNMVAERNALREDNTSQFLYTREVYQKVFLMLSALQMRLVNPDLKSILEFMGKDKLIQGGKRVKIDEEFLEDIPESLRDSVKQVHEQTQEA